MKIPITPRLLACCSFVSPGDRVADVGCDHGYLSIYLLTQGISPAVIASDINEKPLQCAVENAAKFGVSHQIRFYCTNGVRGLPRDFDTLVCAGMGADVMVSILEAAPWLQDRRYRLVLQCQSKTPTLRSYLSKTGWEIRREEVLRDGRFLYTVMEAVWAPGPQLSPGESYLSPALLASHCPEKQAYVQWVTDHLRLAVTNQGEKADPVQKAALIELEAMLQQHPENLP